jgi:hypothetical protein
LQLSRAFGWTPNQCDEIELEMLFDYLIISAMEPREGEEGQEEQTVYVDQVFF